MAYEMCVEWLWYRFPEKYNYIDLVRPIKTYSEIGDEYQEEVRKIEFFINGKIAFASQTMLYCEDENHDPGLSDQPMPDIEYINNDQEMLAVEISREQFEKLWDTLVKTTKEEYSKN